MAYLAELLVSLLWFGQAGGIRAGRGDRGGARRRATPRTMAHFAVAGAVS
jgi:hypothetical protein